MQKIENSAGCFTVQTTSGKEVALAMQELWLTGQICPAGARLVVRHVFESREEKMLEAVYAFSLPRDAALRQFRIEGLGFTAHSELKPMEESRKIYEDGVSEGHLAALAQQYRDGRINLTLGNLRPRERVVVYLELVAGVELKDGRLRFRFPFTLSPTYHPEARYVESAPGAGEMELPESKFGDILLPPFHRSAKNLHRVGFDLDLRVPGVTEIASPSHTLRVLRDGADNSRIALGQAADMPNRDLVLDAVMPSEPSVLTARDSAGKVQVAAVLPSTLFGKSVAQARRVLFLLDRSGSMRGDPLDQAKNAIRACLGALNESDLFGVMAFDNATDALADALLPASGANRKKADAFLNNIEAGGGTELLNGFLQAVAVLNGQGGDVFLVTDGQVSETDTIILRARAEGIRLHTLGIGSAAQDRFLTQLSRKTGGISRCVTPKERVDLAALELFASCSAPVAEDLSAGITVPGRTRVPIEPEPPKTLFSGVPALIFAEIDPAADGTLELTWGKPVGGRREIGIPVGATDPELAETLKLLRGARLLADAEVKQAGGQDAGGKAGARAKKWIEALSRNYGLASRHMSLVAVVERQGDRPGEPPVTRVVPVGMPEGIEDRTYFSKKARRAGSVVRSGSFLECCSAPPSPARARRLYAMAREVELDSDQTGTLIQIAGLLEADGGMPGSPKEERLAKSLLALLLFLENGHTLNEGPFRAHIRKLIQFVMDPSHEVLREHNVCREGIRNLVDDMKQGRTRVARSHDWVARLVGDSLPFRLKDFVRAVDETQPF